jgi:hypothetical protein
MNVTNRAHLDTFLTAIDASPTALERPVCRGWVGDYQITGKHGHVLADHPGYLLYVTGTVQRWKKAKRILPGTVTQDGDAGAFGAQQASYGLACRRRRAGNASGNAGHPGRLKPDPPYPVW